MSPEPVWPFGRRGDWEASQVLSVYLDVLQNSSGQIASVVMLSLRVAK
jgi:hypothetical protein